MFTVALVAAAWLVGTPCRAASTDAEENELVRKLAAATIAVEQLPAAVRGDVDRLIHKPSLYHRGPIEAFPCRMAVYEWLLDHPDWACLAWKELGAKGAAKIERQANESFTATDSLGSKMRWQIVLNEPGRRLWYAEGSGRAMPLMPAMSVKAVVLLTYEPVTGKNGKLGVRHRAEVFAEFDGKAASRVSKLFNLSAEQASKKTLEQLSLFFSGLAWYVCEQPEKAHAKLKETRETAGYREIQILLKGTGVAQKDTY